MFQRSRIRMALTMGLLSVSTLCTGVARASHVDLVGTDFTLAFLPAYQDSTPTLSLTSGALNPLTTVVIQWPMGAPIVNDTVTLAARSEALYALPPAVSNWTPGFGQNAVSVHADYDIGCVFTNSLGQVGAAAAALPNDALGTEYQVTTYDGSMTAGIDAGQFIVVGITPGTEVTVTPSNDLVTGQTTGSPFPLTLGAGEAFLGQSAATTGFAANLSGTNITATDPVVVFEGNICTQVPGDSGFCNTLMECSWPIKYWDSQYVIAAPPGLAGSEACYYTLQAVQNSTVFTYAPALTGAPLMLNAGQYAGVGPVPGDHVITANHPFKLTQFVAGSTAPQDRGPEMMQIPGTSHYWDEFSFSAGFGSSGGDRYVTLYADAAAASDLTLDGTPVGAGEFTAVGTSGYWVARLALDQGLHTTASESGRHVPVIHDWWDGRYTFAYQGGAYFEFICPIAMAGDINVSGTITSADIIYLVNFVFKGGLEPLPCTAAGDVNCNGSVTSADIIQLVGFVFKGGEPPCDACTSPLAAGCP